MTRRRVACLAVALIAVGSGLAGMPAAWAHSPTDFLKVSVGRPSTVLLPPMATLPGRLEVTISAPAAFTLSGVSAGPGWRTRLAPNAAVLDGRSTAGRSLLVTVTGTARRPGRMPLDVRVTSPVAPSDTYHWRLTALAGYAHPTASLAGAARPDAPVAVDAGTTRRLWPVSLAFAVAAFAVLVVRRRTRA